MRDLITVINIVEAYRAYCLNPVSGEITNKSLALATDELYSRYVNKTISRSQLLANMNISETKLNSLISAVGRALCGEGY